MNVTLKICSLTSQSGKSYDCIILTTQMGLEIKIVDFNAVQRVRDILSLGKALCVPPEQL